VLEGIVRVEGTGAPLAGARVDVSRSGRPLGRSVSAQNGRFAIPLADDRWSCARGAFSGWN
jgi:hypothetical protein